MTTNISKGSANKFQLIFPLLPELDEFTEQKQFSLNIIDGILPSFTLNAVDLPYKGGNTKIEMGFDNFGDWVTTFSVDSNFKSGIIIADGMFSIANNQQIHGRADQSYQTDANMHILDNFENKIVDIKFENIWPTNLGEIKFSYQDNDQILTCSVTFSYDRFYRVTSK